MSKLYAIGLWLILTGCSKQQAMIEATPVGSVCYIDHATDTGVCITRQGDVWMCRVEGWNPQATCNRTATMDYADALPRE